MWFAFLIIRNSVGVFSCGRLCAYVEVRCVNCLCNDYLIKHMNTFRYREDEHIAEDTIDECYDTISYESNSFDDHVININSSLWKQLFNPDSNIYPNAITSKLSTKLIIGICKYCCISSECIVRYHFDD